jgi:hypothetical protein
MEKGGVLRPPAIAGRPVHLLHSSFTEFSDRFFILQLGNFYLLLCSFFLFFNFLDWYEITRYLLPTTY